VESGGYCHLAARRDASRKGCRSLRNFSYSEACSTGIYFIKPPFEYVSKGHKVGFEVDLMDQVSRRLGVKDPIRERSLAGRHRRRSSGHHGL
jgi:hypothetical protein